MKSPRIKVSGEFGRMSEEKVLVRESVLLIGGSRG